MQASSSLDTETVAQNLAAPTRTAPIRTGGLTTIVRLPSADNALPAVLEHWLEPGTIGAPLHRHSHEDEISHVLEGELTVWDEGTVSVYGVGATAVKPRQRLHTFWNAGTTPLRFIEIITPGSGFDRYFADLAPFLSETAPPDMAGVMGVAARYGLTMDMEGTFALLETHGVRL